MSTDHIGYPIARVDFVEAETLADLGSLTQDLGAVMQTCSRLKDLLQQDSKDHILVEALWTCALIRYARCFVSGKRYGLDETAFSGLNGDPVAVHRLYIDMRNKHVAHSVNPFEQMEVGLVLTPKEKGEKSIVGVSTLAMRHITADLGGVRQLGMLAKIVLGKICDLGKEYEQKVLEVAKTLPIDELYLRARPRIVAPGPDVAGKPRT
ncbi:MAG: hypothetical protein ACYS74_10715 [Planctomycetota bacterium]|jgi:hypothetical protein